jgi:hypothetical protein
VPAAVEGLLRADLDLKSSADSQIVLERFVVELCEGPSTALRAGPSTTLRASARGPARK